MMRAAIPSTLLPAGRDGRWIVALWILAALLAPLPARADEHIWSALLLATQVDKPKPAPPELAKFSARIQRIFGYNQLEIIGSATKTIDEDFERWLVPSQNFWLCAKAKRTGESKYLLDLSLFQDKRRLVDTQAKLGTNSPLLIRGPVHERGQLIIILQVQP
jgi:hypothetical protein